MNSVTGVLMSIKPKYAQAIKSGKKRIELRKCIPQIEPEDIIVFYESSPVQKITFYCRVLEIVLSDPQQLWDRYNTLIGISKEEFEKYFANRKIAYGIRLQTANIFAHPLEIKDIFHGISVPQSFRYISRENLTKVLQQEIRS